MEPSPIHGSSSDERSQSAPAPTLVRAVATGSFRQYLPADLLFNGLSRRLSHDAGVASEKIAGMRYRGLRLYHDQRVPAAVRTRDASQPARG